MGLLFLGGTGCGWKASPKPDIADLEQAFGLTPGALALPDNTPAGAASRAAAAIRAQDWIKTVALLDQLQHARGLTADQMQAVHNASANAYVRMVQLPARGDADAQKSAELDQAPSRSPLEPRTHRWRLSCNPFTVTVRQRDGSGPPTVGFHSHRGS